MNNPHKRIRASELRVGLTAETELGWRQIKRIDRTEDGRIVVSQVGSKDTVTLHPQKRVHVADRSCNEIMTDLKKAAVRLGDPALLALVDEAYEVGLHETL